MVQHLFPCDFPKVVRHQRPVIHLECSLLKSGVELKGSLVVLSARAPPNANCPPGPYGDRLQIQKSCIARSWYVPVFRTRKSRNSPLACFVCSLSKWGATELRSRRILQDNAHTFEACLHNAIAPICMCQVGLRLLWSSVAFLSHHIADAHDRDNKVQRSTPKE